MPDIVVYFLSDKAPSKKSYRGFTCRGLRRRVRAHRGIIKGGAKYTRSFEEINVVAFISGFPTKSKGLSYEWFTKRRKKILCHEKMLRFQGSRGRSVSRFFAPLKDRRFSGIADRLTVFLSLMYFTDNDAQRLSKWYGVQTQTFNSLDDANVRSL